MATSTHESVAMCQLGHCMKLMQEFHEINARVSYGSRARRVLAGGGWLLGLLLSGGSMFMCMCMCSCVLGLGRMS